jgi:excisionase family DNA binding protein
MDRGRPTGLTTGQVARFCLVTPDTIVNWIKAGRLLARRTAGGQFRVLVDDLRAFLLANGMETDLLDARHGKCVHCWDGPDARRAGPIDGDDCATCLVFRTRAIRCFELRCALISRSEDIAACEGCRFIGGYEQSSCEGDLDVSENSGHHGATSRNVKSSTSRHGAPSDSGSRPESAASSSKKSSGSSLRIERTGTRCDSSHPVRDTRPERLPQMR